MPAATNEVPLTSEQRQALETRDVSIALSAGAGCGKTFVLTERFLSYFEPGADDALAPDQLGQLVAITFTERAAREMRDRIRARCFQRLLSADATQAPHWSAMLRALDGARISTIHSFCAALLRSRAIEAGVDPEFAVLEQAQADTLLAEVSQDEIRRLISEQDPAVMALADYWDAEGIDERVRLMVRKCPTDQFAVWRDLAPESLARRWHDLFLSRAVPAASAAIGQSGHARTILAILGEFVPENAVMRDRRQVLREVLPALALGISSEQRLREALASVQDAARVQGGGGARTWPNDAEYGRFKHAAEKLREAVKKAAERTRFDQQAAEEAASAGGRLLTIAEQVRFRYDRRKAELNALDFSDLLSRAHGLLTDPRHAEMRARLSSQIKLLLVDEFQDTDPVQVGLVKSLCGEGLPRGKLFFVGDYKQSIYRFRGAMPQVFRELREQTPTAGRLSLTRNFRSQPAILEFVNALFWHDLGKDYEPLRARRPQVTARPAVEFLWAESPQGSKENVDQVRRREAEWIAARIRHMVDQGEPLVADDSPGTASGGVRPPRLADFAILFRALSNVELYENALRDQGLGYYLVGGHAFYAQQEVFDLVNLLRAVEFPADMVSLVGVLRSGFFSLSDETIFWLCQQPPGLPDALFAGQCPSQILPTQQARVAAAAETIGLLRGRKNDLRISELIELALSRTGYDAILLGEFMGQRKLANLRKLIEQARAFQRGDLFDLADFIAQLSQFVARQPDEPLAATYSEDADVIRLMTIHQAKGLEFPIVFVPDLDRPRRGRSAGVHFDPEWGPLVELPPAADSDRATSGYDLWSLSERVEDTAERHRLLYVAATRAADYLVLSSGIPQRGDDDRPWMQLLESRFDLRTGQFIGVLPKDEPRPEVRVTSSPPPVQRSGADQSRRVDLERALNEVERSVGSTRVRWALVDEVPADPAARREYSFSRIAGSLHPLAAPSDGDNSLPGVDALGLGSLVHAVLAAYDYRRGSDVARLIRIHAQRQGQHDEALLADAQAMVERFVAGPRARSLASATQLLAEVEFLLPWPPDPGRTCDLSISGYLDCLYRDALGQWHLLDFKTNRVPPGRTAEVAARYEMQMLLYGLAIEQILQTPPASLALCFLRDGSECPFGWDAAAKRRAIQLVDQGIATARLEGAPPYRGHSANV